jgi:spore maturation protein CgeB
VTGGQAGDGSILYVGADGGTSLQRAGALERIGYRVTHLSPYSALPGQWSRWLRHFGGPGIDGLVAASLRRRIAGRSFDVALVDSGDVVGPRALREIRRSAGVVGSYNADNPFAQPPPEGRRWTLFRNALPLYDLKVAIRRPDLETAMRTAGARGPLLVWQCADEVVHRPIKLSDADVARYGADVLFAGTWMPGRGRFMADLVKHGLSVRVHGPRWNRAPEQGELGGAIVHGSLDGLEYSKAIAAAKVAIVLLNGDNFDLHTKRSVEIPAIGTAMCAVKTSYHRELYVDGREAVFFDNAEECARLCKELLADPARRQAMALAGHQRTFANKTYNEFLMREIAGELQRIRSGV